jgi:hypothetical protein
MIQGIQNFLDEAGEAGCYVLSLASVAEEDTKKDVDIVAAMLAGVDAGAIYYNKNDANDNMNFFVLDAPKFLQIVAGGKWEVRKEGPHYHSLRSEYEITRWERVKTGHTLGHFNRPTWEPYLGSLTVKFGKIVSKRICRRVA